MTNHFPKSFRLCSTGQFQKVFAHRHSAADGAIILFAAPNELPHCRLGLSVSKKVGNAVVRNRWKRLIREAFRQSQSELPGGFDLVILPQKNVDVRTVKHLEQSLKNLTAKIVKRTIRNTSTVLLTRPEHQVEPMKTELEALGFRVLLQPTIDILPPESWQETDEAIQKLRQGEFDWLIFSSSNGVHHFFDRVIPRPSCESENLANDCPHPNPLPKGEGTCWEQITNIPIAVVGSNTDAALYRRIGRHADVVPETFTAEAVAEALLTEAKQGKRFLHLRANRGRDVLKHVLTASGGSVIEIAVYRSVDRTCADPQIMELLRRGGIDFVTVTSSAIATSLVAMFGELLRQTCLVSISPITSQTLCDLGFPPQREANEASPAGIVVAIQSRET
jgi:ribonuclease P protein component